MGIMRHLMPPARIDVHQHFWPEPFLEALARRTAPPSLVRTGGAWVLRLEGEPDYLFDARLHDRTRRERALDDDGVDAALLSLSSPFGIETLPAAEAAELLTAWHSGVFHMGDRFGVWGAVAVTEPDPGDVDELLDCGAVGISLPAGALATPEAIERIEPLLRVLEGRDRPLLVHPGPARAGAPDAAWWAPAVPYVSELHAAWHAFAAWGRPALQRLRVVFAALAGGAPVHVERLAARGGPVADALHPLTFYDTSSYGPRGAEAVGSVVGIDQLVHGSDRPVLGPPLDLGIGPAGDHALRVSNPGRLLAGEPVGAGTGA
jgi:hypothetical protein